MSLPVTGTSVLGDVVLVPTSVSFHSVAGELQDSMVGLSDADRYSRCTKPFFLSQWNDARVSYVIDKE